MGLAYQSDWQSTSYSCLAKYSPEKTANIFTMQLLVSPWNDNLVSASDWLKQISHVAWPIRRTTQIWVAVRHQYMEFLHLFLTRHFAGKPVVVSWNVGCFLRLTNYVRGFVSKEIVVLCWWGSKTLKVGFINLIDESVIHWNYWYHCSIKKIQYWCFRH